MNDQDASIEDKNNELSAALDSPNPLTREAFRDRFVVVAENARRKELGAMNHAALKAGCQYADNRLDFWQLRHEGRLWNVEVDVAFLSGNRNDLHRYIGIEVVLSGTAVELPGVPGTDEHIIVKSAFSKWPALMGTDAFQGMKLSLNVTDGVRLPTHIHFEYTAFGQRRERYYFNKGHR
jgi:hypothetical protein